MSSFQIRKGSTFAFAIRDEANSFVPEITACYGSDMTEHALNHRFRRLRAHCTIIREGRKEGLDMKDLLLDLPDKQEAVDKNSTRTLLVSGAAEPSPTRTTLIRNDPLDETSLFFFFFSLFPFLHG